MRICIHTNVHIIYSVQQSSIAESIPVLHYIYSQNSHTNYKITICIIGMGDGNHLILAD